MNKTRIKEAGNFTLDSVDPAKRSRGTRAANKSMQFCEKCGRVMTNGQWSQHKSKCQGKTTGL